MKCFLISDNVDTKMGMRLAGVQGVVVHSREETLTALKKAVSEGDIAVIMITKKLTALCSDYIYDYKLNNSAPLIVEIPDRHGNSGISDTITGYVNEAIGIKL